MKKFQQQKVTKLIKILAEYSEPILKVVENLNQKTACKFWVNSVDCRQQKKLLKKADLPLKSTSHQTNFDSYKKEEEIFKTQHPSYDLLNLVQKEDKETEDQNN